MAEKVYKNALIDGRITDFTVEDGKFSSFGKTEKPGEDLDGFEVLPGLVDIHLHGVNGFDTMDGDKLGEMAEYLAAHGTTAFCPTTMTAPVTRLRELIEKPRLPQKGAEVLGFHLEGPYLSPDYCGAQKPEELAMPKAGDFPRTENIRIMTVAPEIEGVMELIRNADYHIALGHTAATYEKGIEAFEAGADSLTHTYNAMPPFRHREPSVIGAALVKNGYAQAICDGKHIHMAAILALYRMFGKDRMILISDSMRATGLPDGVYDLGGQPITVKNGTARTEAGALAGSTSTLWDCVKVAVSFGIPKADAVAMASRTPADYLGVRKGRLEVGFDADFLVADQEWNLKKVVLHR